MTGEQYLPQWVDGYVTHRVRVTKSIAERILREPQYAASLVADGSFSPEDVAEIGWEPDDTLPDSLIAIVRCRAGEEAIGRFVIEHITHLITITSHYFVSEPSFELACSCGDHLQVGGASLVGWWPTDAPQRPSEAVGRPERPSDPPVVAE